MLVAMSELDAIVEKSLRLRSSNARVAVILNSKAISMPQKITNPPFYLP